MPPTNWLGNYGMTLCYIARRFKIYFCIEENLKGIEITSHGVVVIEDVTGMMKVCINFPSNLYISQRALDK